jgi:hypothetical protein
MIRGLSLFGMAAMFLVISPVLRGLVFRGLSFVAEVFQNHSPYSYVLAALGLFVVFTFSLNRGAQPR